MPLDLPRIRALCFDVDGTLRDTDDQLVLRLVRYLRWLRLFFPNRDPQPFARKFIMAIENPGNLLLSLPDRLGFDQFLAAASSSSREKDGELFDHPRCQRTAGTLALILSHGSGQRS
jgi:phosphoglycolate phosphatase-like HAD superfamily hydrolase